MKLHRACALGSLVVAAAAQSVAGQLIGQNFSGSNRTQAGGVLPPHTNGAVGTDYFVEFVKNRWATYRKSDGGLVTAGTAHQFWNAALGATTPGLSIPSSDTISYPRIIYDHASRRWFASSIDVVNGQTKNTNNVLLAVSNSADPTAGWRGFKIDPNNAFADFATLGLDADGVYLATNNYAASPSNGFLNVSVVSIPKSDLLLSTPSIANRTVFAAESAVTRGFAIQPSINMGPSTGRGALLAADFEYLGILDRTNVLNAAGPGAAALSNSLYLDVHNDDLPPLGRQPDGTRDLDTGEDNLLKVVTVGNTIWAVNGVNRDGAAAVRWYKIDEQTTALLATGIIGDPAHDLSFPSIAANENGDVVIGFTRSGPAAGEFASSYAVVGQTAAGGATTFGAPFQLKQGLANYHALSGGENRWGAYSNTTVDPADPQTFWTIQEYAAGATEWATQVSEIIVPRPNEFRWKTAANGNFATAGNWFAGVSPVGQANARVIFSRATDPAGAGYTVSFTSSYSNSSLTVRQGKVTFDLGGEYSLTSTSTTTPGVIVGEYAGNSQLTLTGGGQLTSVAAAIAPSAAATASVITNNVQWLSTHSIVVGGTQAAPGGVGSLTVGPSSIIFTPEIKAWSTGTVHLAGGSVDAGALVRLSGGRLSSSVTSTLAAPVTSENGQIQVDAGTLTLTGTLTIPAGATLQKSGPETLTIAGSQAHGAGASLTTSAGITNINTNAGSSSAHALTVNANGTTNFNASQNLAGLNIGPGATATLAPDQKAIRTHAISLGAGSTLNLTSSNLVVDYTGPGSPFAAIAAKVQSGAAGGAWTGTGIRSSAAAATATLPEFTYTTALGTAEAKDVLNLSGTQTALYRGQVVDATTVLVAYTYGGDANLDGLVSGDDYTAIDFGVAAPGASGWINGDFNYDGIISGDDYTIIDFNIAAQEDPIGAAAGAGAAAAVPEPASVALLLAAPLLAGGVRRRRRQTG